MHEAPTVKENAIYVKRDRKRMIACKDAIFWIHEREVFCDEEGEMIRIRVIAALGIHAVSVCFLLMCLKSCEV